MAHTPKSSCECINNLIGQISHLMMIIQMNNYCSTHKLWKFKPNCILKLRKHNNWPENYVKTTMKTLDKTKHKMVMSMYATYHKLSGYLCDCIKWLLFVDKNFGFFVLKNHSHQYDVHWDPGQQTNVNTRDFQSDTSYMGCRGNDQQDIWKPSGTTI